MTASRGLRTIVRGTLAERFWPKVDASGDCWEWTGARNPEGYGRIGAGRRGSATLHAHRVAWELLVGPVPAHLELDHLCRNPRCVNPDHLEPVSRTENIRRGQWKQRNADWHRAYQFNRVTRVVTNRATGRVEYIATSKGSAKSADRKQEV